MESSREENTGLVKSVNNFGFGLVMGGVIGFINPEVYDHSSVGINTGFGSIGWSLGTFIGNRKYSGVAKVKYSLKSGTSFGLGVVTGQYAGQTAKMFFG